MGAEATRVDSTPKLIDIVELSPVATMAVAVVDGSHRAGRVVVANAEARRLLGGGEQAWFADFDGPIGPETTHGPFLSDLFDEPAAGELGDALRQIADLDPDPDEPVPFSFSTHLVNGDGGEETWAVHLRPVPPVGPDATERVAIVQLVPQAGWDAVDTVLSEQQRFRSALLELSEQASTTEDDDEFYRRLIELAVEVVPGAQGGSVQLNIPGTTRFRFVAAYGYDIEGLRRHDLQQDHFFRDAWNPIAQIVRNFSVEGRSREITDWLESVGRLSEIVVNVSAPVLSGGFPVAFLSLDNFEDPDAMTDTSIEMTTVLSRLIGELWRRRELEAEVRKEREAYRHLALHDPLTGLANRRNLEAAMADRLRSGRRRGHPQVVLFVDIDDFKGVNDRLGHEVGDRLLAGVANGLVTSVRLGDVVGRWGGDEFLVVPHRLQSPDEALSLAERILACFERDLDLGDEISHRARLTIGVGWDPNGEASADELVRAADDALYQAKAAGKGLARLVAL